MPANNKRDFVKTPIEQHRKKIGQHNNKQNEVFNKKLKTAAIQRKQQPFFSKHKKTFVYALYIILFILIGGAVFLYLNNFQTKKEEIDL